MNRSRSMTGLNLNLSQDLDPSPVPRYRPFDRSLRRLKDNLDDSENRRVVLVHKLKEAQETLEVIKHAYHIALYVALFSAEKYKYFFLISAQKHMLWVLIRSALPRHF